MSTFRAGLAVMVLVSGCSASAGQESSERYAASFVQARVGDGISASREAAPPTATPPAPTTTKAPTTTMPTTTTTVPPAACQMLSSGGLEPPFDPLAPWNVPVCGLARDPRSDEWRDRFWYWSHYNPRVTGLPQTTPSTGRHNIMFGLDADPLVDFSVAVYDARDATGWIRVFQRNGWRGSMYPDNGGAIPWNPAWKASWGSDAMMVILDPTTGREWDLWGVVQSGPGIIANDTECWHWKLAFFIPGGPYVSGQDLCVGSVNLIRTADLAGIMDYRTYGGNAPGARGVGIQESAMLVTPEAVASGRIRHALMMPVYNTMTGPNPCTEAEFAAGKLGQECGHAVAPAGNFEREGTFDQGCVAPIDGPVSAETYRRTTIPEGIRYALDLTPAEIEAWLDQRGYTGARRSTARVFARALVEFGWFITDTSCYGADFQVASGVNPATAAAWRALGIHDDGRDLLDGLFRRDRIYTVAPPTNHCIDGRRTKLACPALVSRYP